MIRSTVDAAVVVCSVPNTRWPGFCRLDGDGDRLQVAQLADEDDVGVLAQRRAQRVLERVRVGVHFALVDQALLVLVHELDRIFDRDDVILARPVDVIDHRAQRRRFSRAGRPGDEHQPLVQFAQLQDVRRQTELLGGQDLRRDDAEDRAGSAPIGEDVRPETRQPEDLIREVRVVPLRVLLAVLLRHDRREQRRPGPRR